MDAMVQLADWYHDQSEDLLALYLDGLSNPEGNEPVFQSGLINGKGQFNCSISNAKDNCNVIPPSRILIPRGTLIAYNIGI
jgi:hypothetical protein